MSSFIIGFYVNNSLSVYNGFLEIFHINNQTILHFINIWSKEVPVNISYPSTVNKIDGYLDASISPTYIRYIISREKKLNSKKKKTKMIQVGGIIRLLIKIS